MCVDMCVDMFIDMRVARMRSPGIRSLAALHVADIVMACIVMAHAPRNPGIHILAALPVSLTCA